MTFSEQFEEDLIANPERNMIDVAQSVLQDYGVSQVCYFASSTSNSSSDIATNYPSDWAQHYMQNRYFEVDPVLSQIWKGHRPINWVDVKENTPVVQKFFGEAGEFGISSHGLTIPIRDTERRCAYFSVSTDVSLQEWRQIVDRYNQTFRNFAFLFHVYFRQSKCTAPMIKSGLSEREIQVLSWAAGGKSAWETSQILGISQRTVDSYIRSCLKKLEVTNKTQAVATAAACNLLETDLYLRP